MTAATLPTPAPATPRLPTPEGVTLTHHSQLPREYSDRWWCWRLDGAETVADARDRYAGRFRCPPPLRYWLLVEAHGRVNTRTVYMVRP